MVVNPAAKDKNSRFEATLYGVFLNGALSGVLAKKDNWIWSFLLGVFGAFVGWQAEGG